VAQARYALQRLIDSGSPHPPVLPEFMVLARALKMDRRAEILDFKKPEMTAEQIEFRRKQMRDALKEMPKT